MDFPDYRTDSQRKSQAKDFSKKTGSNRHVGRTADTALFAALYATQAIVYPGLMMQGMHLTKEDDKY